MDKQKTLRMTSNVSGFIFITSLNMCNKTVTSTLSPAASDGWNATPIKGGLHGMRELRRELDAHIREVEEATRES